MPCISIVTCRFVKDCAKVLIQTVSFSPIRENFSFCWGAKYFCGRDKFGPQATICPPLAYSTLMKLIH